jgi:superfamily II DNA helicase RecQ
MLTTKTGTDYVAKLIKHLRSYPGPTIVYVTLQKGTEVLASELVKRGFPARPYHGGMTVDVRTKTQDDFLASKNLIVVATIAFGMGIDKSDIRNIVHFDIPDSIESYSQQIGRAGRDGKPSVCMFYLATKDFHLRNIFTYGARPSLRSLKLLLEDLCAPEHRKLKVGDVFTVSMYTQAKDVDIGAITLGIIYAQLELTFKLFRAAGSLYTTYKYAVKDSNAIARDTSTAAVVIQKASVKASRWTYIAVDDLAKTSRLERADIVRKLDQWNEQGAIELKKEGVRTSFRLERPLPSSAAEIDDIIKQVDDNMGATEQMNLARTKALIDLVTDAKCFSHALAGYFGETGNNAPDNCGHCTWCETRTQVLLPDEPPQPPDPVKVKMILNKISVRDDPRFLAKVAFGIKSPRATDLKVYNTGVFESMNVCDFTELLRVFTEACDAKV